MKRSQFRLSLLMMVGAAVISSSVAAQEHLEAVIRKYKNIKSADINVITQKDPKTLKLLQIITSITIRENLPQATAEILEAFEKDKPKAFQAIDGRTKGRVQPMYNFIVDKSFLTYALTEETDSVMITKIERPEEMIKTYRRIYRGEESEEGR